MRIRYTFPVDTDLIGRAKAFWVAVTPDRTGDPRLMSSSDIWMLRFKQAGSTGGIGDWKLGQGACAP